jgi:curved DNA-binding protein
MAVKYRDYYDILGVARTASQDEIRSAYRKLARQYHPDVNKAKDAEDKFKDLGEAYEVLGDPEKRRKYDQLGADWRAGEEFTPPPGWNVRGGRGGMGGAEFQGGDFSDFFEAIFGGASPFRGFDGEGVYRGPQRTRDIPGEDQEVKVRIPLEDAFFGAERDISFEMREVGPDGRVRTRMHTLRVNIPKGVTTGQRIRLAGQGAPGHGRGQAGDLYLLAEIEPHPRFRVEDHDLHMELPVAPWEAALGANVIVPTLAGDVSLTIPPGTSSGQRLRLRGKGMSNPRGADGDLYATVKIVMPKTWTKRQREAWETLRDTNFNPR